MADTDDSSIKTPLLEATIEVTASSAAAPAAAAGRPPPASFAAAPTPAVAVRSGGRSASNILIMMALENKLNKQIGSEWWRRYIAAAFWSNLSTPINLAITLCTALTTANSLGTGSWLPQSTYITLSVVTLILSTINTFFRPTSQLAACIEMMNKWAKYGAAFEEIFFDPDQSEEGLQQRLVKYRALQKDMNEYRITISPDQQNYFTDALHMLLRCMSPSKWRHQWDEWVEADQLGLAGAEDSAPTSAAGPPRRQHPGLPRTPSMAERALPLVRPQGGASLMRWLSKAPSRKDRAAATAAAAALEEASV